MPRHTTVKLAPGAWTLLNPDAVAGIRVQNIGPFQLIIQATDDAGTPPVDIAGAIYLQSGEALTPDQTIAGLFGGTAGAAHLWGLMIAGGSVSVSYA